VDDVTIQDMEEHQVQKYLQKYLHLPQTLTKLILRTSGFNVCLFPLNQTLKVNKYFILRLMLRPLFF